MAIPADISDEFEKFRIEIEKLVSGYENLVVVSNRTYIFVLGIIFIVLFSEGNTDDEIQFFGLSANKYVACIGAFLFICFANYRFCSILLKSYQCYRLFALRIVALGLDRALYCGYDRKGAPLLMANKRNNTFFDQSKNREIDDFSFNEYIQIL